MNVSRSCLSLRMRHFLEYLSHLSRDTAKKIHTYKNNGQVLVTYLPRKIYSIMYQLTDILIRSAVVFIVYERLFHYLIYKSRWKRSSYSVFRKRNKNCNLHVRTRCLLLNRCSGGSINKINVMTASNQSNLAVRSGGKSPGQEIGLGNRRRLKVLNDTKLVLNEHL